METQRVAATKEKKRVGDIELNNKNSNNSSSSLSTLEANKTNVLENAVSSTAPWTNNPILKDDIATRTHRGLSVNSRTQVNEVLDNMTCRKYFGLHVGLPAPTLK